MQANKENTIPQPHAPVFMPTATTFHVGHLVWFLFTQSICNLHYLFAQWLHWKAKRLDNNQSHIEPQQTRYYPSKPTIDDGEKVRPMELWVHFD